MVMTEAQIAGAVNGRDEVALETEIVQGFHADEPLGVLVEQLGEGGAADVADEMIEGLGDREGVLLGARQEVEVVEDGAVPGRAGRYRRNGGCPSPARRGAIPTSRESGGDTRPWARSGCRAIGPASRAVRGRSGGRF